MHKGSLCLSSSIHVIRDRFVSQTRSASLDPISLDPSLSLPIPSNSPTQDGVRESVRLQARSRKASETATSGTPRSADFVATKTASLRSSVERTAASHRCRDVHCRSGDAILTGGRHVWTVSIPTQSTKSGSSWSKLHVTVHPAVYPLASSSPEQMALRGVASRSRSRRGSESAKIAAASCLCRQAVAPTSRRCSRR